MSGNVHSRRDQAVPSIGVGLIISKGDEVLLLRRHRAHGAGTWSTPGGHLDFGETLEECARREAREESGLEVANVRFLALTNDLFEDEGKHYITVWMEADYVAGEPGLNAPEEASEISWFSWDGLPEPLFLPLRNLLAGACYPPDARERRATTAPGVTPRPAPPPPGSSPQTPRPPPRRTPR